jgi:hypothetical protein
VDLIAAQDALHRCSTDRENGASFTVSGVSGLILAGTLLSMYLEVIGDQRTRLSFR